MLYRMRFFAEPSTLLKTKNSRIRFVYLCKQQNVIKKLTCGYASDVAKKVD